MRLRAALLMMVGLGAMTLLTNPASGQLFQDNFDGAPGAWNFNYGADTAVTVGGVKNEVPTLGFDYSTMGIPPAPSQVGSSTKGMQLKARLNSTDPATGISVSPTGQSFTGNYKLTFDVWANFNGATEGGAAYADAEGLWEGGGGSTLFSNFGILSSGTGGNYQTGSTIGVAEALFFSATGDGQNSYDYRVHSSKRTGGYRGTVETAYSATLDAGVTFADTYPANHPQGGEGETNRGVYTPTQMELDDPLTTVDPTDGELYRSAFPAVAAPGQEALYPAQQYNTTMQGAFGMAWRTVEIKKDGNLVTWSVLNTAAGDVVLATVDLSVAYTPAELAARGTNIMFGHADGLTGTSSDANFEALQFTLIDNVKVEALAAPEDADFDDDGDKDGNDFLIWQRGIETGAGTVSTNAMGDANGDTDVDGADLAIWENDFGTSTAASAPVPEPATWAMAFIAAAACLVVGSSRRRVALAAAAK